MTLVILEEIMSVLTLVCNFAAVIIFIMTIQIPFFIEKNKKLTMVLQSVMMVIMIFTTIINFAIKNMLTAIICMILAVIGGFLFLQTHNTIKRQRNDNK